MKKQDKTDRIIRIRNTDFAICKETGRILRKSGRKREFDGMARHYVR